MISMTTRKAKIAVTIDSDVLGRVKSTVAAGEARNVSAYVEHAVICQLAAEASFDAMLAEMLEATGGQPTDEERAEARRLFAGDAA